MGLGRAFDQVSSSPRTSELRLEVEALRRGLFADQGLYSGIRRFLREIEAGVIETRAAMESTVEEQGCTCGLVCRSEAQRRGFSVRRKAPVDDDTTAAGDGTASRDGDAPCVRNLAEADLSGLDLSGANLSGANMSVARLDNADLSGAILTGANLSGAVLTGANLAGADLSGATLDWADLSRADLTDAKLLAATMQMTITIGTRFRDTLMPDGSIR